MGSERPPASAGPGEAIPQVPLRAALRFWTKLGFINFGGPAGQIAVMHDELVDRRRWISNERFLHALNYCMLLPGPEAQQLAIYVGWLLNRTAGGIAAGVLFVLPGFFFMLFMSWLYAVHGDLTWAEGIFFGLRATVIAIVALAVLRVGSRALKNRLMYVVAAAAFVSLFLVKVPFPLVVLIAGVVGFVGGRSRPDMFVTIREEGEGVLDIPHARPTLARSLKVLVIGLSVWWGPLLLVGLWQDFDGIFFDEAIFFSKAAMVTFGGAYAVLSYLTQAAVVQYGWLLPAQMITGLGLAETTPGPLILVTEFVGFLAGYRFHGSLDPVVAGVVGAAVTTWATFAPCFLWIFLGAPFIERLRGNKSITGALSTITSAVVGVLLNLALFFAIQTLFKEVGEGSLLSMTFPWPEFSSLDLQAVGIAVAAGYVLWRHKWPVIAVIASGAGAGLVLRVLGS